MRPPVRNFLDGVWLEAPLHPGLTDVLVGAWTTALLLDSGSALTGDKALGGPPIALSPWGRSPPCRRP